MKIWNQFWIVLSMATCVFSGNAAAANDNQSNPAVPNQKLSKYALGDKGPSGGIVFLVDAAGLHGVEATSADETQTLTWHDAVAAVKAYGSDWRLPTRDELLRLYKQRKLIGGFNNDDYWSSTEQDVNSAWIQGFRTGDQDRYNKNSKILVRAVRSF